LAYSDKSVLTIIFQYNLEVLNLIVTLTAVSVITMRALSPVPFLFSQVIVVIISSSVTLAFILGFAISSLKILLVTQFYFIFLQDPDQLGQRVFKVALTVAAAPIVVIGFYLSFNQINAAQILQLVTENSRPSDGNQGYILGYMIFWAVLCVIMLVIAVYYIPLHIKYIEKNNAAIQAGEANTAKKNPNIKKILFVFIISLCCLVVFFIDSITHSVESRKMFPSYILSLVPNIMLLVFTLEADIVKFVIRTTSIKLYELQICRGCSVRVAPLPQQPE
jgi:hypothetical protein